MTYTEEEITCYTNILKNLNDGLGIYTPILENIPIKSQKSYHVIIVVIHIFSKNEVYVTVKNVFIIGRVLSKIILPKTVVTFRRKVFTRDHIISKIS